mmetsp:Transcript_8007/g.11271  ORF Transcript_8007/g.11271 Transcript_8007/m.11271 type:complete len:83 (-) Transcript_8007:98-346(-)
MQTKESTHLLGNLNIQNGICILYTMSDHLNGNREGGYFHSIDYLEAHDDGLMVMLEIWGHCGLREECGSLSFNMYVWLKYCR